VTNSQTIHTLGLPPLAEVEFRKKLDEGPAERQEDLRQVQGDSPARSRNGDLRESAAQAAAGLTANQQNPSCERRYLREQLQRKV
jgi:hypothetical protein